MCEHYRIRHSEFLGWDRDDRDKALAWHLHQSQTCPDCHTRPEEWDPARGGHRHAYHAEIRPCPGCAVAAGAIEALQTRREQGHHGLHLVLAPTPDIERR